MSYRIIIILFLLCQTITSFSQKILKITEIEESNAIFQDYIEVYVDSTNALDFEQISSEDFSKHFVPVSEFVLNEGEALALTRLMGKSNRTKRLSIVTGSYTSQDDELLADAWSKLSRHFNEVIGRSALYPELPIEEIWRVLEDNEVIERGDIMHSTARTPKCEADDSAGMTVSEARIRYSGQLGYILEKVTRKE